MHTIYEIFPLPQSLTYGEKSISLTQQIHIIPSVPLKDSTLSKLTQFLNQFYFTPQVVEKQTADCTSICLSLDPSISHKEGYILHITGDTTCRITISGHDLDGLHYGVITLGKILANIKNSTIQELSIIDYPETLYRGYIEGFYGFPWSHNDRKDLMIFGGEYKLNTYIYAPKDDPYHRSNWRDLYPEHKAQEIAELAQTGHDNNLNFVWTIHPGDSIDLDSEADFQSTIHKFEQLYTLGVRQFGILFDDIGGLPNGTQQAHYINRVDTEFIKKKGNIRPLLTVGTRYCEAWGPSMEKYFTPFVELLHNDVEIMWTGSATMSTVSKDQFDAPKRAIATTKNFSVWWNYPVNDYCDAKLLMGKIENLYPDVDNINGFFSNPMNQAQASKQALFCIADYNWNIDAFNTDMSFEASFKALAPEVSHALQIVASNCSYVKEDGGTGRTFLFDESWYLREAIEAVQADLATTNDITSYVTHLLTHFKEMQQSVDTIIAECRNVQLVAEMHPFLAATHLMGQAGQNVMEAILALKSNNLLLMEEKNQAALYQLEAMENCKVLRLKDGAQRYFTVDVGTLLIKPFLNETLVRCAILAGIEQKPLPLTYLMQNIALSSLGVTAICSGGANEDENPEKAIDGTIHSGKWCSRNFRPSLTVDLKEVKNIKQYQVINCGHPEAGETQIWNTKHLQLLTSLDGENFTLVDEVMDNTADIINRILFDATDARYVRLQIIEPAQISINGGGHTRIYAFELFDIAYPSQSKKVQPSQIEIQPTGQLTIYNTHKGDQISLYTTLSATKPYATSESVLMDGSPVVFKNLSFNDFDSRVFIERVSRNYLPSVRTSKSL